MKSFVCFSVVTAVLIFYGCNKKESDINEDNKDSLSNLANNPSIHWQLIDHLSETEISEKSIKIFDSILKKDDRIDFSGNPFNDQYIPIDSNFFIGCAIFPVDSVKDFTGFGLFLKNNSKYCFSWDWFVVDSNLKAHKLQGSGAIEYKLKNKNSKWELSSVLFLSDAVLRLIDKTDTIYNVKKDSFGIKYRWSCKIFKDSYIQFK